MILTTNELLKNGETEYSIRNKIRNNELFLIERGLYSDKQDYELNECYICKKYPNSIITGLSAFYLYNLTDYIPEYFYLATEQHSFPIRRKDVKQSYQEEEYFRIGLCDLKVDDGVIHIYDFERLLIELVRLKEKYPKEIYYEVVNSFRKTRDKIDFYKVNDYCKFFSNGGSILIKIKEII